MGREEIYEFVHAAGGNELVAYTEYREHVKTCALCNSLSIDDQITCNVGIKLFDVWQQRQVKSLIATLEATGDFVLAPS